LFAQDPQQASPMIWSQSSVIS